MNAFQISENQFNKDSESETQELDRLQKAEDELRKIQTIEALKRKMECERQELIQEGL